MNIFHQSTGAVPAHLENFLQRQTRQAAHSRPGRRRRERGTALMIALIVTGLVAFVLAAYLSLLGSQNTAVMRSQAWNAAVPVIEAGVEDALSHLNTHGTTNLNCDNWNKNSGLYWIQRYVGSNYYIVTIDTSSSTPIIDSRGFVMTPILVASLEGPLLAANGFNNSSPAILSRGVRVGTIRSAMFLKGLVARDSIDLMGNNVTTDSFDSGDANFSSNGVYTVSKHRAHGDVAVNSSIINSLNAGNANIFGTASTGPNGTVAMGPSGVIGDIGWHAAPGVGAQPGAIKSDMNVTFPDVKPPFNGGGFTPNGTGDYITNTVYDITASNSPATTTILYPVGASSVITNYPVLSATYPVGSAGPVTTNTVTNTTFTSSLTFPAPGTYLGNVTTRITCCPSKTWYDYNSITSLSTTYTYPTYTAVYTLYTTNVTTTVTYYDYILDSNNYQTAAGANFNGKVYVRGDAILYIADPSSGVNLSGIDVAPGKSLKLYSAASSVVIGGNTPGLASGFSYFGLPSNTSLAIGGNGNFTGTVYAPNAELTMNGGGNNIIDFMGASVTKTVKLNGHFNFHYDEALNRIFRDGSFIVTSWNEMTPQEVNNLPGGVGH